MGRKEMIGSMCTKMTLEFTKEIILSGEFRVFEILNREEDSYDYYLWKPSFPMVFTYGVATNDRMSLTDIVAQYESGYFDAWIEEEFV